MTSYSCSQLFTYGELYSFFISVVIAIKLGYHHVYPYWLWSQAALASVYHAVFSLSLSFLICIMRILTIPVRSIFVSSFLDPLSP